MWCAETRPLRHGSLWMRGKPEFHHQQGRPPTRIVGKRRTTLAYRRGPLLNTLAHARHILAASPALPALARGAARQQPLDSVRLLALRTVRWPARGFLADDFDRIPRCKGPRSRSAACRSARRHVGGLARWHYRGLVVRRRSSSVPIDAMASRGWLPLTASPPATLALGRLLAATLRLTALVVLSCSTSSPGLDGYCANCTRWVAETCVPATAWGFRFGSGPRPPEPLLADAVGSRPAEAAPGWWPSSSCPGHSMERWCRRARALRHCQGCSDFSRT